MKKTIIVLASLGTLLFGVTVFAQESTPEAGQSIISLLVILGVFGAVFYFF